MSGEKRTSGLLEAVGLIHPAKQENTIVLFGEKRTRGLLETIGSIRPANKKERVFSHKKKIFKKPIFF